MFRLDLIRGKLIGLALTMFVAVLLASGTGGYILYQTSIAETAQRLTDTAKSNARLIEAIANHEITHSENTHPNSTYFDAAVEQIKAAHEQFQFGLSGEFTLAKIEGSQIVFLMRNHLAGMDIPAPVPFNKVDRAEPMRRALSGRSGWMIGNDYRGEYVMAAYEPVTALNIGLVAKIDMREIREPFIKTGLIVITLALIVSLIALRFFYTTSQLISDKFRDSTKQFERLAGNAKDMIYRMSLPDGKYEYVNAAANDIFELSPEEFYANPILIQKLIHPEWNSYFKKEWKKLLAGDMPDTYEYQIQTLSGKTKWISQRNVLIKDKNGKPIAIEGIATDITNRRQMEDTLRESERKLSTLMGNLPGMAYRCDNQPDWPMQFVSEGAFALTGCTPEELTSQKVIYGSLINPDDAEYVWETVQKGISQKKPFILDYRIRTPSGQTKWVWERGKGIFIEDDQLVALEGFIIDITDRMKLETQLKMINQSIENSLNAFDIVNDKGEFIFVNKAYVDMWGFDSADEIIGTSPVSHCADPDQPNIIMATLKRDGEYIDEFKAKRKDGSLFDVQMYARLDYDFEGNEIYPTTSIDVTERKQSELNLRESEKRLRTLLDTLPDLVWMKDRDGVYLSCNSKFLGFLDLPEEEIIGKTDHDLFDDSIADFYRTHDKEAIAVGEPCTNEEDAIYSDGRVTQLETIKTPVFDSMDGLVGVLGIGRDITDRKKAERKLIESERLSRATFDQAAVGIARVGTDGKWLDVNQKLCDIVGYTRDQLLTKTFQDITHPDDMEADQKSIQDALSGKLETIFMDKRYIKSSGNIIWVRITASLVDAEDGKPQYFIAVIEDINERKKAEEKLREAAAVFSSTAEGVLITDKEGTVLDINDAFTEITEYSREEVIGQSPRILKSGRHEDQFYTDMWEQLIKYGHWNGEIWNRKKSGAVYPEILTINSVESESGEVTGYVGVFTDISSLKETEDRLHYLAHHDPLTDLPNRLLFRARLIHSLARVKRSEGKIAVVFVDLDHFKNVNDTLGHSIGDQLLVEVAKRMKVHTREGDTVGRISGDEFCLLFEGIKYTRDTSPLIEKLSLVFEEPFDVNDNILHMSASIGIAIYPDNSKDPDDLLSFADAAMYEAKEAGRNTYRFYSKEMTEQALEYRFVQSALKDALDQSQFSLVYQPQVDLNTKSIVGLEVLTRWLHPEQGKIPPVKFIPIAEQSGFIRDLGAWILRAACTQGKIWLDEEREFGRLFVNIAGPQLHDEGFYRQINDCLAETGFPPNRLGLEVTEGFVMQASEHALGTLLKLRDIGVQLAIDDFGTGYSSLSYLKSLPIDKLKIDQSFIRDIPVDSNDMAIAETVIAMGRALQMNVIAEGVEKEVQAEFLRSKGCQEAQGYLYGRPLKTKELEKWMEKTLTKAAPVN